MKKYTQKNERKKDWMSTVYDDKMIQRKNIVNDGEGFAYEDGKRLIYKRREMNMKNGWSTGHKNA